MSPRKTVAVHYRAAGDGVHCKTARRLDKEAYIELATSPHRLTTDIRKVTCSACLDRIELWLKMQRSFEI